MADDYKKMWDDFGKTKAKAYTNYKFQPTHRIGLTNYLREELIYKFLNPGKEDIILDIGCASGRQLLRIANKIKEGYGVDIASTFIEEAEKIKKENEVKNVFFQTAVIEKLPFVDNFFSKIICAEVLEHVANKDTALKEMLRVLSNRGELIITVPNINSDATVWGRILRLLNIKRFIPIENFSQEGLISHGDAHVREFNKENLVKWLKSYTLKIEVRKSVSYIDGPYFNYFLKFPLHFSFSRKLIIIFENLLTYTNLFYGRHLAVKVKKQ